MKLNLDNIPLFAELGSAHRQKLVDNMQLRRVRQGERIFGIGDGSEALYVIEIGWAKLLDADGLVVANLGPGNQFGESEVLSGRPRELQAIAGTDMAMWAMPSGDLDRLVAEDLDLGLALSKAFGARIAQLTRFLAEERLKPIPFFFELDYDALADVADRLVLERYQHGSFLFHRGGWARALFIIESGRVNVVIAEPNQAIQTMSANVGAVVGEIALLTGKPYSFTAEVDGDAVAWALNRDDFDAVCERYPSVRLILSRSMFMSPPITDKTAALDYLSRIPLFAELSPDLRKAIAQRLILRHVPHNELVYAEGSPGEAMYIVDGGEVEVVPSAASAGGAGSGHAHDAITVLREGEYFGETALLTGRSRSSAVRAATNANLWTLYRSDFDELMVHYPAIRKALAKTLGQELSDAGHGPGVIEGEIVPAPQPETPKPIPPHKRTTAPLSHPSSPRPSEVASGYTPPPPSERPMRAEKTADSQRDGGAKAKQPAERKTGRSVSEQRTEFFQPAASDDTQSDVVPSRYREEFVRPSAPPGSSLSRPAGRESEQSRPSSGRKEDSTEPATGVMPRRREARAGDRTEQATGVMPAQKMRSDGESGRQPVRGPRRIARWFADLSFLGKIRLVGLLLLFTWLCGVTAPASVLWGLKSAEGGGWNVQFFPDLTGGGGQEAIVSSATPEQVAEMPPAVVEVPTDSPAAPPTDTPPPPTDTPAPTDTPQPTDTPPPPTATPLPTNTPSPTPDLSAVVSANVAWVRIEPSGDTKAVAKLEQGDKVTTMGRNDDGTWIQIRMADGMEGWAEARYLDLAMQPETLPQGTKQTEAGVLATTTPAAGGGTPKATATKAPPAPTPTVTDTPTPEDTPTPPIRYTAPVQTAPQDGWQWTNGRLSKNYLEWESLSISEDEFYNVTIIYKRNGEDQYFGDSSAEPRYLLPDTLYDVADQHTYRWRVVVRKEESRSAEGKPDGPAISPESGEWSFKWD